jgi:hypothetical protein
LKYEIEYTRWEYGLPRSFPRTFFTFVEAETISEAENIIKKNTSGKVEISYVKEVNENTKS